VKYHNIVGRIPDKGLLGRVVGGSDGVVSCESAHVTNVSSEIEVNADHLTINRHPLSVLEVHRILLEHLAEVDAPPGRIQRLPHVVPVSGTSSDTGPAPPAGNSVLP
jgi:hypothetical protein